MNGAESLVQTLVDGGVDVCFSNPGTSEMHFVAALDRVPGVRCVLCLFEGGVSGAADGYARMADKPAATLLHCGPGLGNAIANLHNAKRARSPVVNIVGDHATYHVRYDAPLTSDAEGLARPVSAWVRRSANAETVGADAADAIAAALAPPGQVATLILPADTAWTEGGRVARLGTIQKPAPVRAEAIDAAARAVRAGAGTMLLLGHTALRQQGLDWAGAIAAKTGCRFMAQMSNARMQRGAGRVAIDRIPYPVGMALTALKDVKQLVLVGTHAPVAFFAYPGKPSALAPAGCEVSTFATPAHDLTGALAALGAAVGAKLADAPRQKLDPPPLPRGALTSEHIAAVIGALMPENAIVCDESVTTGRGFFPLSRAAQPHDWMQLTGGAIGEGIPMATGAAIACPDRKVINFEADGSAMYTVQSLWTQAREKLNVMTLIWSNRAYEILRGELTAVGAKNPGRTAMDMLSLGNPDIDWIALAKGMGVEAVRADTIEALIDAFKTGLKRTTPFLIEVVM
ncbi:MAG: acetolactate synthase large subunit [Alphaproteobacteria bacterium]|nr:acetolactate synthase large subunit [Alphaproteobacteria bacterium]